MKKNKKEECIYRFGIDLGHKPKFDRGNVYDTFV